MRVRYKHMIAYVAALWSLLFVFLASTNPLNSSALLLMLPMAILFCALAATTILAQQVIGLSGDRRTKGRQVGFACLVASLPTSLLLLRSINQLTPKDLILIGMLAAIAFVYVRRFRFYQKIE